MIERIVVYVCETGDSIYIVYLIQFGVAVLGQIRAAAVKVVVENLISVRSSVRVREMQGVTFPHGHKNVFGKVISGPLYISCR